MVTQARQHYQRLINEREAGLPFTSAWLHALGVSPALAYYYVTNGLLQRLGRGFYCLPKDAIEVSGMLAAIQHEIPGFHVASRSALAWYGIRHNLYARPQTIVWGSKARAIPKWMSARFNLRYSTANLFQFDSEADDLATRPINQQQPHGVRCSCPERALLEMLYELPLLDYEEVQNLFELVQYPRESVLAMLLKSCRSIKVVRLFAQFAMGAAMLDVEDLYCKSGISTGSVTRWTVTIGEGRKFTTKPLRIHYEL